MRDCKITIYGAGGTGAETAKALTLLGATNLVLIDIEKDLAIGKALDISQSGALLGTDIRCVGDNDIARTEGSDVIVITAGYGRRPGISREQLIVDNGQIIQQIARDAANLSPNAFIVMLTNPADVLARIAFEASGFAAERVLGQGGVLDSARMATLVAAALNVSVQDVHAMVLGGHGDHMVPVRDFVRVRGIPVQHLLAEEQWQRIVHQTRFGGGEILAKFRTHGASVTPGIATAHMVYALFQEVPRVMPVSIRAGGAYGLSNEIFIGLPAQLSSQGAKVVEVPLSNADLDALHASATALETPWNHWCDLKD